MLVDILHKISQSLSRENFARILFHLIHPDCSSQYNKLEDVPYNRLKPILNEQYTLKFINNLNKANYTPEEISGVLIHLYHYSHVSNIKNIACITLQPHVFLGVDKNGKYFYNYETFHLNTTKQNITYLNNIGYVSEPIEFVERPCIVDVKTHDSHIKELELLYDMDKCDQYLAFHMMLGNNNNTQTFGNSGESSATNAASADNQPSTSTGVRTFGLPSTTRDIRAAELNKTSRSIFSRPYWMGYYYYGLENIAGNSYYMFESN